MKSFIAASLVVFTGLVTATTPIPDEPVVQLPDGTFKCNKPNVNYCAGDSLGTNIIFRCDATGKGQPGNCNDNLAGQPPQGVGGALCYQSSKFAGDAACAKNCIVYSEKGKPFTLPHCVPTYTATTSTATSTTTTKPSTTSTPCETTSTTKKPTTTSTPCETTTSTTKKPTTTSTPCETTSTTKPTTTSTPCETTSTTKKPHPTTSTPCETTSTTKKPHPTTSTPCETTSTTTPTTVVPPPTTLSTMSTVAPVPSSTFSAPPTVVTAGAAVQRQGGAALALVGAAAFLML